MVPSAEVNVRLSPIDEERFGIRSARVEHVRLDTLPAVLEFCREHGVVLLIARCRAAELAAAQAMEAEGFRLMDTLVHSLRDLVNPRVTPDTPKVPLRALRPGDEAAVTKVAAEVYRGYRGHYHADPRLDPTKCDETYASWASLSCTSADVAEEVFVADRDGDVVGFMTIRRPTPELGQPILSGVSEAARGLGLYRSLLVRTMEWSVDRGAKRMLVVTQVTNVAVQKIWARLGFEPSDAEYTFHKWFDEDRS